MARTPSRYKVHLLLAGGATQSIHFATIEAFQEWYLGSLHGASGDTFVNVPISDLEAEYLLVRPSAVQAIRVEPLYSSLDD